MAKIIIKIEQRDVVTYKVAENYLIQCKDNIDLIFTPEAIKELIDDYYRYVDSNITPLTNE